jgi:hypothetical protein
VIDVLAELLDVEDPVLLKRLAPRIQRELRRQVPNPPGSQTELSALAAHLGIDRSAARLLLAQARFRDDSNGQRTKRGLSRR